MTIYRTHRARRSPGDYRGAMVAGGRWNDQTMQPRGFFRGFEILSRGKGTGFSLSREDDRVPDLSIRGCITYSANLNPANPIGTVQSIEHTLRNLDRLAAEEQNRVVRLDKELTDYRVQADRPFEHKERLKQLLARQAELDSLLDLAGVYCESHHRNPSDPAE